MSEHTRGNCMHGTFVVLMQHKSWVVLIYRNYAYSSVFLEAVFVKFQ